MFHSVFLLFCLLVSSLIVQDVEENQDAEENPKFSPQAIAYANQAIAFRENKIIELEKKLQKMRRSGTSGQQLAEVKKQIDKLKKSTELPRLTMRLADIKVGSMGRIILRQEANGTNLIPSFRVIDVLGKDSAIVRCEGTLILMVKGIDTTNLVTGRMDQDEIPNQEFIVTGTETYDNVAGGRTTVFVLEAFNERFAAEEFAKILQKKHTHKR